MDDMIGNRFNNFSL